MTAREEILAALPAICASSADATFAPADVLRELHKRGTRYSDGTIRAHVISYMCTNAPQNHGVKFHDLERVGPGRYRARPSPR